MRIAELMPYLRVCRKTIWDWIHSGKLKATKLKPKWGGHPYYDITKEDLAEYLKSNESNTKKP
jgi:excisionase family DNA binding protein